MATVLIPGVLRACVGGAAEVRASATTVRAALAELDATFPGLAARVLDARGELRPFVRVFRGADEATLDTALGERDQLAIVAAVAGGAAGALSNDQIRRYARHILLPEVGGVGQAAVLAATARIALPQDAAAALIAAGFVAAAGAGTLAIDAGADPVVAAADLAGPILRPADRGRARGEALRDRLAELAPDCTVAAGVGGRPVALAPDGPWFPAAPGDDLARALWRGGLAAVRWLADTIADAAPSPIAIPPALLAAIYDHARAAFPAECCGYLVGPARGAAVDQRVACTNAAGDAPVAPERDRDTSFAIAGAELFAFARSFEGPRPARVVYHSHTNGRAYFSALDRAFAHAPGEPPMYPVQHVVIGVTADAVTEAVQLAWSATAGELIEVARWTVS